MDKKVPTTPDGVTLRDDPMTKIIAFLNYMPKLTQSHNTGEEDVCIQIDSKVLCCIS